MQTKNFHEKSSHTHTSASFQFQLENYEKLGFSFFYIKLHSVHLIKNFFVCIHTTKLHLQFLWIIKLLLVHRIWYRYSADCMYTCACYNFSNHFNFFALFVCVLFTILAHYILAYQTALFFQGFVVVVMRKKTDFNPDLIFIYSIGLPDWFHKGFVEGKILY